jgi:tetratricopeptide (TPR) repeat protein
MIGRTYRESGALEDVRSVLEKALLEHGREESDARYIMGDLAMALSELGRHEEALVMNEQVLELRKRILGAEHPATLTSMVNLASTLRDLGRNQEALVMREQVPI